MITKKKTAVHNKRPVILESLLHLRCIHQKHKINSLTQCSSLNDRPWTLPPGYSVVFAIQHLHNWIVLFFSSIVTVLQSPNHIMDVKNIFRYLLSNYNYFCNFWTYLNRNLSSKICKVQKRLKWLETRLDYSDEYSLITLSVGSQLGKNVQPQTLSIQRSLCFRQSELHTLISEQILSWNRHNLLSYTSMTSSFIKRSYWIHQRHRASGIISHARTRYWILTCYCYEPNTNGVFHLRLITLEYQKYAGLYSKYRLQQGISQIKNIYNLHTLGHPLGTLIDRQILY